MTFFFLPVTFRAFEEKSNIVARLPIVTLIIIEKSVTPDTIQEREFKIDSTYFACGDNVDSYLHVEDFSFARASNVYISDLIFPFQI